MGVSAWLLVAAVCVPAVAGAVQLDALDPGREWRLGALRFHGNHALTTARLEQTMTTAARPWYAVWRSRPPFDPVTLRADLRRLGRLYEAAGYYHARITHDVALPAEGDVVAVDIWIEEGPPVRVRTVHVTLAGATLAEEERRLLLGHLPVVEGDVFTEEAYGRALTYLRAYYREHAFARVDVRRQATVDVEENAASVRFDVESGPASVFGDVHVEGLKTVDEDVVRHEIAFEPGAPFKQSLLDRTRSNLVGLRIFRTIRIREDPRADDRVDIGIAVVEGPTREVRLGLGYDTDEQVRGIAAWRDYDFNGGARQLGFTARASFIRRTISADFLQPHFPGLRDRIRVLLFEQQEDEPTFTNDRARFSPRIEWQALPFLTPYAFYRVEYDSLSGVTPAVKREFPAIAPGHGVLSGLGFGVDLNTTDDLLDPRRGWVTNVGVEPVGGILGGDFSFVRVLGEVRRFQPLLWNLTGAGRFRLGAEQPTGGSTDVPLFERFYAGGINSVRGYGRWRVGPLVDDDPIGGKSLIEASVELRHPITEKFGAAVFLDAGQVALASFDYPIGHLRYGAGFGVSYRSPVGPLRIDLGFPFHPPDSDQPWQVHFSIGQTF